MDSSQHTASQHSGSELPEPEQLPELSVHSAISSEAASASKQSIGNNNQVAASGLDAPLVQNSALSTGASRGALIGQGASGKSVAGSHGIGGSSRQNAQAASKHEVTEDLSGDELDADDEEFDVDRPHTYVLQPVSDRKFNQAKATRIMKDVLSRELKNFDYDPDVCSDVANTLAIKIRNRLREARLCRYKCVVQVVIMEKKDQGVCIGARCVWDKDNDDCAHLFFRNATTYCLATCYGCYLY